MTDVRRDNNVDTPHAVPAKDRDPKPRPEGKDDRQDDLLDEGIEETFPASDPVSVKRIT